MTHSFFDTDEFKNWSAALEVGMKDAEKAPDVPCPACGENMVRSVGLGKLAGYTWAII